MNSLQINAPYVFYSDEDDEGVLPILKALRNESFFDTKWVHRSFKNFRLANYSEEFSPQEQVWMEKVQMMYDTYKRFPKTSWHAWIDSGINTYRHFAPPTARWPEIDPTRRWPRKFVFQGFTSYHGQFPIAATAFLVHRDVMEEFVATFYRLIQSCLSRNGDADPPPKDKCQCRYWHEAPNGKKRSSETRCRTEQDVLQVLSEVRPNISHAAGDLEKAALNWGAIVTESYKASHNIGLRTEASCFKYVGVGKGKGGEGGKRERSLLAKQPSSPNVANALKVAKVPSSTTRSSHAQRSAAPGRNAAKSSHSAQPVGVLGHYEWPCSDLPAIANEKLSLLNLR